MDNEFGLKELYDLTLKTTYPIEMEGRTFEKGEVIARFDKISIANFREITERVSANGGFGNRPQVIWEDPKEIQLNFTQGIFSKRQLALLSNSKLVQMDNQQIWIPAREVTESDENSFIHLKQGKVRNVFIYDATTYEKISYKKEDMEKGILSIAYPYKDLVIDYEYVYQDSGSNLIIGQKLINGFLSLEGKTRVKDDITGKTHTAILRIPRLKLVSDLSMRLGREATPMVANFFAVGYPDGDRRNAKIMELLFLNDDIDAEM